MCICLTVYRVKNPKKKLRRTERVTTTALYMLRCFQVGMSIADLEQMSVGMVLDIFTESSNDQYDYKQVANQADFEPDSRHKETIVLLDRIIRIIHICFYKNDFSKILL